MSADGQVARAGRGTLEFARRLYRAWAALDRERRRAALAAIALFLTLFLPWYSERLVATGASPRADRLQILGPASLSAWDAFSWVEAAVLLVALGVLFVLLRHAEERPLRLPGGDGWAVTLSGGLACLLIIWRMFNEQGVAGHRQFVLSTGIDWGIFVALLVAAALSYSGNRIRTAGRRRPQAAGEAGDFDGRWDAGEPQAGSAARSGQQAVSGRARRRGRPRRRSSWRPAESPTWTAPQNRAGEGLGHVPSWPEFDERGERPPGWLTAPPTQVPAPDADQGDGTA